MDEGVAPAAVNQSRASSNPGKAAATRNTGPQVIELATGMNYWDGSQWLPSDATFELTDDAFVANRVQHRTRLNADLNVIGAVTTTLQDGTTLRSTPIAIALYDPNDGRFAVISTLTNCTGILVESNQVLYPDAFSGGVCASVIYTLQKGSFEQDVVISGRLNPLDYSFPTNAQIQIVTEFYDAPQPEKLRRPIYIEEQETVRRRKVSPDLVDEVLGFSDLVFATGRAYTMPSEADKSGAQTVVAKEFRTIPSEDRTYLIETLNCLSIQKELNSLPECEGSGETAQRIRSGQARDGYAFIPKPASQVLGKTQPRRTSPQFAQIENLKRTGVVVDYFVNLGGALGSGYTFKSDTTYLVSGTVYCNGPVTLEAAVLKYKSGATIKLNNTITCKTASYRPAIFTCVDDDSVGESLWDHPDSGWTGSISSSGYANPAIWSYWDGYPNLSNVRFRYAQEAVRLEGASVSATISHAHIVNCIRGIVLVTTTSGSGSSGFNVTVNNSLLAFIETVFVRSGEYYNGSGSGFAAYAYFNHCTIDSAQALVNQSGSGPSFVGNFRNSILANIGSLGNIGLANLGNSTYNGFYSSPLFGNSVSRWISTENPFQASGGGAYYLKADSVFRSKGTTVGSPTTLLSALKTKSTQPPMEFPSVVGITGELSLFPQTPRYVSGAPDLGYYYDALDYSIGGFISAGATITVYPGTAIGMRHDYYIGHGHYVPWKFYFVGFELWEGSVFNSQGTAAKPIIYTEGSQVWESVLQTFGWGTDRCVLFTPFYVSADNGGSGAPQPVLNFRFSNSYVGFNDYHLAAGYDEVDYINYAGYGYDSAMDWSASDCSFFGGRINLGNLLPYQDPDSGDWLPVNGDPKGNVFWFNNLFETVDLNLDPQFAEEVAMDFALEARNNTFRNSRARILPFTLHATSWSFRDNLFEKMAFQQDTDYSLDHDHNAYWARTQTELDEVPLNVNGPGLNSATLLANTGGTTDPSSDVTLTAAPIYQTGPLGNYYLYTSSLLYNTAKRGSRSVADAGLYHYTTRTDQTKDGAQSGNIIIGHHYVATANSTSVLPKDSDSDGIPDYVENWHGDGDYASHTDSETNPYSSMTDGATPDASNSVYDNRDLDGDGMEGDIERLWCKNPLTQDNPLMLQNLPSTELSGVHTFTLNVSNLEMEDAAGMDLLLLSGDVWKIANRTRLDEDAHSFTWNTAYDESRETPFQLRLGSIETSKSVLGPLRWTKVNNPVQLVDLIQTFGNQLTFNGQTQEPNNYYRVWLYDQNANPIMYSVGGNPNVHFSMGGQMDAAGKFSFTWDLRLPDASTYEGNVVQATARTSPTPIEEDEDPCLSPEPCIPPFAWAKEDWSGTDKFITFFGQLGPTPATDDWQRYFLVMGPHDALKNSAYPGNAYELNPESNWIDQAGFPNVSQVRGWTWKMSQANHVAMLNRMAEPDYRNLFFDGHGNTTGFGGSTRSAGWLSAKDISDARGGNIYGGVTLPYRFVFLYCCCTARGALSRSFGIPNEVLKVQDFVTQGVRARAFVGAPDETNTSVGNDLQAALNEAGYLRTFYILWRGGQSSVESALNSIKQVEVTRGIFTDIIRPGIDTRYVVFGATDLRRNSP